MKRLVLAALAGILAIGAMAIGVVLSSTRAPGDPAEVAGPGADIVAPPDRALPPLPPLPPLERPPRAETPSKGGERAAASLGPAGPPPGRASELPESWRSPALPLEQQMPPRRPAR